METYYYYRQSVLIRRRSRYSCSFAPAEQFLRDRLEHRVLYVSTKHDYMDPGLTLALSRTKDPINPATWI